MTGHSCIPACVILGIATAPAGAGLVGVVCEPFVGDGWTENGYAGLATYRVYAVFEGDPHRLDGVVSVYGVESAPLGVRSTDGLFHNDEHHDSLTEPEDLRSLGVWSNQWDTYATIGFWFGTPGEQTQTSPGFDDETNGLASDWLSESAGWFVFPCDRSTCPGETADGRGRILLLQLTVADDADVSGTLNLLRRTGELTEGVRFSSASACSEDLEGSGTVDVGDVLAVLAAWGPCTGCPEDLDESGAVDFADVLLVLAAGARALDAMPLTWLGV